jgi:hypothetical protein
VELYPNLLLPSGSFYAALNELLATMTTNGGSRKHEHENEAACAVAEIFAGSIRATTECVFSIQSALQNVLIPLFLTSMQASQPDALPHYMAALRYIYHDTDPRRFACLSRELVLSAFGNLPDSMNTSMKNTTNQAFSNAPSIQYKRFRFLLPILIELDYNSNDLGSWMLQTFVNDSWLEHPYKQVRQEIAFLITVIMRNMHRLKITTTADKLRSYSVVSSEDRDTFISRCAAHLMKEENQVFLGSQGGNSSIMTDLDVDSSISNENTKRSPTKGPIISYIHSMLLIAQYTFRQASELSRVPLLTNWFSLLIRAQHVADFETANTAKEVCQQMTWGPLRGAHFYDLSNSHSYNLMNVGTDIATDVQKTFESILQQCADIVHDSNVNWHVKLSVLQFLQVVIPRHAFLSTTSHVENLLHLLVEELLINSQVEVREMAGLTLISFARSMLSHPINAPHNFLSSVSPSAPIEQLQKTFKKLQKESNGKSSALGGIANQKRPGAVLGYLALIAAHPYDLPSHLPNLLDALTKLVNSPQPISTSIRKGFAEFVRTHSDEWSRFKLQFTEEQLDAINAVNSAPTYFA